VDGIVEGSVLRVGDRVRITAQLIQAEQERHLWAESYERDLRDILALQSEVARAIASEIKATVTPVEERRLASARRIDPEVHEAYLQGRYYSNTRTEEALRRSLDFFEQAIKKDPGYAPAYAGMAGSYRALGHLQFLPQKEAEAKVEALAKKALELDETFAEAHRWLGNYRRALELNPSDAQAHAGLAYDLSIAGRHEEAIAEMKRAEELDPLSTEIGGDPGWVYYMARHYDQAIEYLRRVLEAHPKSVWSHSVLGEAYLQKGMYAEAIAELQHAVTLTPGSPFPLTELGNAYAVAGKRGEALKILAELKTRLSKGGSVSSYDMAVLYAGLGEKDEAFASLRKAFQQQDVGRMWTKVDPRLDPLRSDPRFQEMVRRMNFPP
jgi:tetratricopeptide (TPR) repeat protein